ncbi:hypothetical protein B1757_07405 [Acidithiobacillus marinus]|uniref:Uncharacterized protein n=1 Tax=Acidithiobacillus marinus TaxID=187490 RepID=A0A2I1DLN3_9PROT|nr:hypothetical protein [Acidithiobacillus marinus]PKY10779.1 hypothetical protein B1757_07405 [Acidithiobacillus marinus]
MFKWLLLAGFVGVLFYIWRKKQRPARQRPEVESLVRCSRCGRYVSAHNALRSAEGNYRCSEHASPYAGQQNAGDSD